MKHLVPNITLKILSYHILYNNLLLIVLLNTVFLLSLHLPPCLSIFTNQLPRFLEPFYPPHTPISTFISPLFSYSPPLQMQPPTFWPITYSFLAYPYTPI